MFIPLEFSALDLLGNIPGLDIATKVAKPISDFVQSVVSPLFGKDSRAESLKFGQKTGIYISNLLFQRPYDYLVRLTESSPGAGDIFKPDFDNYSSKIQMIGQDVNRYNYKYFFNQDGTLKKGGRNSAIPTIPNYFGTGNLSTKYGAKYADATPQEIYAVTQWFTDKEKQAGDIYTLYVTAYNSGRKDVITKLEYELAPTIY